MSAINTVATIGIICITIVTIIVLIQHCNNYDLSGYCYRQRRINNRIIPSIYIEPVRPLRKKDIIIVIINPDENIQLGIKKL